MPFTAYGDRCCHPHCQEACLKAHLTIELQQQTKENGFSHLKKKDRCSTFKSTQSVHHSFIRFSK